MPIQTPITADFVSGIVSRPVDNEWVYGMVADLISRQPDHLAELVSLMSAINQRIDLVEHWDCLVEAVEEEMENR